jgi:hypothetical protein
LGLARTLSVVVAVEALVGTLMSGPLHAQAIRIRAPTDSRSAPIVGAIADVLDATGAVTGQGLLGTDGVRLVRLAAPGNYRVRVRRVGFEPVVSPSLRVAGTDTVEVLVRIPDRPVALDRHIVTTRRRCAADAIGVGPVAELLGQIRTALLVAGLSRGDGAPPLEQRAFIRTLGPDTLERAVRVSLPRRTTATRPFAASSAAELSYLGYVRSDTSGLTFYAPDEQVLASDEFARDHCFDVVRGTGPQSGLLGVRFTPVPRRASDIAGTLWADSATAELRYVDFWHQDIRLPTAAMGAGHSGGQVLFARLDDGMWIVSAWRLRMPRFGSGDMTRDGRPLGYYETGGVVTPLATNGEAQSALLPYLEMLRPARLAGAVFDSLANTPLDRATVWLEPNVADDEAVFGAAGTVPVERLARTTAGGGRYAFDSIPAGPYRLGVEHPGLDSIGVPLPHSDLRLRPGLTIDGPLATPSRATLANGCARSPGGAGDGILFGSVRAADSRLAIEHALVRVSWTDVSTVSKRALVPTQREAISRTDSAGVYRVCGVPASAVVTVQAFAGRASSGWLEMTIGARGLGRRDFSMPIDRAGDEAAARATLTGVVTRLDGRPLGGARVTVDGTRGTTGDILAATTDDAGRFRLRGLPAGTQTGAVTLVGFSPGRFGVELRGEDTARVTIKLDVVQTLGAVAVEAERSIAARPSVNVAQAIERHRGGFGTLFLEADLQRAPQLQSLMTQIPGARFYQVPNAGGTRVQGAPPGSWLLIRQVPGRAGGVGYCSYSVLVDGRATDVEEAMSLDKQMLRAIEIFRSTHEAPPFARAAMMGASNSTTRTSDLDECGVILFWTVSAP